MMNRLSDKDRRRVYKALLWASLALLLLSQLVGYAALIVLSLGEE
jgi:hypothetical protein